MSDKTPAQADDLDFAGDDLEFDDDLSFDEQPATAAASVSTKPETSVPEKFGDAANGVSNWAQAHSAASDELTPFSGILDKGVAGAYAAAGEGVDLLRKLVGSDKPDRSFEDRYHGVLKDQDVRREEWKDKSTLGNVTGTVAGIASGFATPTPGSAFKVADGASKLARLGAGIGNAAVRTGAGAAETFLDQATRNDDKLVDLERGLDAAETSAKISGALEAIPVVGAVGKQAKRLIPGTKDAFDWVNNATVALSKLNPINKVSRDDLKTLLSDTERRAAVRNMNMGQEVMNAKNSLAKAEPELDAAVRNKFGELEQDSIAASTPEDIDTVRELLRDMRKQNKKVRENAGFYSDDVKKGYNQTGKTLRGRAPEEFGKETYKVPMSRLRKLEDEQLAAETSAQRVLDARRNLDAEINHDNFKALSRHDQDAVKARRDLIQDYLHNKLTGGEARKEADELYSGFKDSKNRLFEPLKGDVGGTQQFTHQKLDSVLKSGTGKGTDFDESLGAMQKWVKGAEEKIGQLPEVQSALKTLEDIRSKGEMNRIIDAADRMGGPTGATLRLLGQAGAAAGTGGLSLILMPITDPGMWTRMVDVLGPASKKISDAAQAIAKTNPALVSRLYLAGKPKEPVK